MYGVRAGKWTASRCESHSAVDYHRQDRIGFARIGEQQSEVVVEGGLGEAVGVCEGVELRSGERHSPHARRHVCHPTYLEFTQGD